MCGNNVPIERTSAKISHTLVALPILTFLNVIMCNGYLSQLSRVLAFTTDIRCCAYKIYHQSEGRFKKYSPYLPQLIIIPAWRNPTLIQMKPHFVLSHELMRFIENIKYFSIFCISDTYFPFRFFPDDSTYNAGWSTEQATNPHIHNTPPPFHHDTEQRVFICMYSTTIKSIIDQPALISFSPPFTSPSSSSTSFVTCPDRLKVH